MEISTPPSHTRKSASRHAADILPSLDLVIRSSPPKRTPPPPSPNPPNLSKNLHELLILSPSPARRSRTRLSDILLDVSTEEGLDQPNNRLRRRCRNSGNRGASQLGSLGSPRNVRRSRRRLEQEDKEANVVEEVVKVKKRRHSGKATKKVQSSSSSLPDDEEIVNFDQFVQVVNDLILWKDVSKSSLWFGFGSICFLSSYFSEGISFSIFSAISQLGLIFLGSSFFFNTICQRNNEVNPRKFKLKEDDVLRAARVILPTANLVISKTRELFSGEPSTTLKVAPVFLLGAHYGHLMTLWRFCALVFFMSFTVPKLYSSHAVQINKQAEYLRCRVMEIWEACSHKRVVALSAVTAFWNLSSVKTRIFAAFLFLVIVRYRRQVTESVHEEGLGQEREQEEQQHQLALVVVEGGEKKKKKRKQEDQMQEEQAPISIEGLDQKK